MHNEEEGAALTEDEEAENAGRGGCGLGGNLDVAVCRAEWFFHLGAHQAWPPLFLLAPREHGSLSASLIIRQS
jgi:hypothetical protein